VIETKNWSGRSCGGDDDELWTVQMNSAPENKRENPVAQNRAHAAAVEDILDLEVIRIVAFVGWGRLMASQVQSVSRGLSALVCEIMQRPKQMKAADVAEIAARLETALLPRNAETRARHKDSVNRARRARR